MATSNSLSGRLSALSLAGADLAKSTTVIVKVTWILLATFYATCAFSPWTIRAVSVTVSFRLLIALDLTVFCCSRVTFGRPTSGSGRPSRTASWKFTFGRCSSTVAPFYSWARRWSRFGASSKPSSSFSSSTSASRWPRPSSITFSTW